MQYFPVFDVQFFEYLPDVLMPDYSTPNIANLININ